MGSARPWRDHWQDHGGAVLTIEHLALEWLSAKADEAKAVERRRKAEDAMSEALRVRPDQEGTIKQVAGPWQVKVVTRFNQRVDADLAQEIAAEHGAQDYLATLFRWKPEVNVSAWKSAPHEITQALARAITTTPGRPSYSIDEIKKKEA